MARTPKDLPKLSESQIEVLNMAVKGALVEEEINSKTSEVLRTLGLLEKSTAKMTVDVLKITKAGRLVVKKLADLE